MLRVLSIVVLVIFGCSLLLTAFWVVPLLTLLNMWGQAAAHFQTLPMIVKAPVIVLLVSSLAPLALGSRWSEK